MSGTGAASDRLGVVYRLIGGFVQRDGVRGAALAVASGGAIVGEGYWGEAAPGQAAAPETLWPLASISKLYTAAAVLALVEQGVLTLATTVRSVLPAFDGEGREQVTLRHLLTHTSGLIYESPEMESVLLRRTPLEQMVDEAYTYPLAFAPGTRFSYSDYGIAIAGRMASVAAGEPFPELVRRLVLEPGDLHDTFMPPPAAAYGRLARVVGPLAEGTDGAMYNSPYALELAHPAFGTVASARDLLRFGLLFAPAGERRILSEATVRAMTSDQTGGGAVGSVVGLDAEVPHPWGFGFIVRGQGGPQLGPGELTTPGAFGHAGASGCTLVVDPAHDLALAFVSNQHARVDPERWRFRLDAVANAVVAAMTRRER
ncbi:MAG TPA: serine hydrolase domain-containing protein [Thermomicrobiaceae bacterium]|nr:serine hydrolase domain-containing protein [Thermomicrobiaceae bacterium]